MLFAVLPVFVALACPAFKPDNSLPPPPVVTFNTNAVPSDAEVLFDGTSLDAWRNAQGGPAGWKLPGDGTMVVDKAGNTPHRVNASIYTKGVYTNFQMHLEWRVPTDIAGAAQARGNSGVLIFDCYEVQILDSYQNPTYPNGQAGAIYACYPPLVNPAKKPGEWQSYDIVFAAPVVTNGTAAALASVTVLYNDVVVQDHQATPPYPNNAATRVCAGGRIQLQAHNDKSRPLAFRNVWIRRL